MDGPRLVRTVSDRTARKKPVFDATVEVLASDGRLRNHHTAPAVSAGVAGVPPHGTPPPGYGSGARPSAALTRLIGTPR